MNFNEFQRISTNFNEFQRSRNFNDSGISTNCESGFTFIETLIAVTILSLALVGTLTIVSRSVQSSVFSRDQIVAFYLAQEAIELLQNKRSTNVLGGNNWLTGLDTCMPPLGPCAVWIDTSGNIQIKRTNINGCNGEACQPMKLNETIPLYHHDPLQQGSESIYRRLIYITPIGSAPYDEIAVSVEMRWNSGTVERTFTIRYNMLNWQE